MEFFSLISIIISLIAIYKVNKLDKSLKNLGQLSTNTTTQVAAPSNSSQSKNIPPTTTVSAPVKPIDTKGPIENLLAWYAHEWPLKTGALFILLGFLWLVTYAFLNNWIGETGRITFGLIAGVCILFFGELRLRKIKSQGITLVGLGAGVVILTTYAAQELYQMFPPSVALGFMILTMILTSFISLRHRVLSLAIFSLVIGGLAPLMIGSEEKSIMGLYGYLLAVTVSTIWIARYSKWRILSLLALVLITLYSLPFFIGSAEGLKTTLTPKELIELKFFAITFCSLFYFSTLASIFTNKKASTIDLQTATFVGFFTLGWVNALTFPAYKSIIILAASLSYAIGAYIVYLKTKIPAAVQVYTVVSMILLAVATAFEFDGPTLTVAFAIEALVLPIVSSRLLGATMTKYMLLYHIIPLALGIQAIAGYETSYFREDFFVLLLVTVTTFSSGLYFYFQEGKNDKELHSASLFLLITGAVYGLIFIWRTFGAMLDGTYIARMLSLVIYTLIGLTAYVLAGIQNRPVLKRFGLFLLIAVIARLMIVEIWDMELTSRIITFFLIGLLFMGSVLLRKPKSSNV